MKGSSLIPLVLVLFALVAFVLDAFTVKVGRVKLFSLGVALLVGAYLASTAL